MVPSALTAGQRAVHYLESQSIRLKCHSYHHAEVLRVSNLCQTPMSFSLFFKRKCFECCQPDGSKNKSQGSDGRCLPYTPVITCVQ